MTLVLTAAALTAGCKHNGPDYDETPRALQKNSFARQWATELRGGGSDPVTAVHLSDQFVFAYRRDGTASVMDRATGRMLHIDQPRDGAQRMRPPVVLKNRIVYPTTTYLEVFDFDGRYIPHPMRPSDELEGPFSQSLNFVIRSDAVGSGRLLFLGGDFSGSGRAVEIDMDRPYIPAIWTLMTPGAAVSATPALVKDVVYIASENGQVAAVQTETRAPLWTLPNGVFGTYGGVVGNLAVDPSGLYVASTDTKLYCLAASSGRVKWQYFAGSPLREGAVVTKDLIYQHVPGTGVAALDKNDPISAQRPTFNREPRWVAADAVQFLAEDDQYAYLRSSNNAVIAVDKKTGQTRFQSQRQDLVGFATNTKDNMVYVATSGGRVMAVKPVLQAGAVGELVLAPLRQAAVASAR